MLWIYAYHEGGTFHKDSTSSLPTSRVHLREKWWTTFEELNFNFVEVLIYIHSSGLKRAPDLQTVEGLCEVPGFIDITKIPQEGEDDELRELVMRLQ